MKHLNDFKEVIAYDFDGTLHLTVNKYGHPLDYFMETVLLKPNWPMINRLKEDAKDHRIVIVTARDVGDEWYIEEFVKLWKLPVEDIFCTSNGSKLPILQALKAQMIYDDNPQVEKDLRGSNVEFSYPLYPPNRADV